MGQTRNHHVDTSLLKSIFEKLLVWILLKVITGHLSLDTLNINPQENLDMWDQCQVPEGVREQQIEHAINTDPRNVLKILTVSSFVCQKLKQLYPSLPLKSQIGLFLKAQRGCGGLKNHNCLPFF